MKRSKGIVDPDMEKRMEDLRQYRKGYIQAMLDVESWIFEANGDLDFVEYRILRARERERE
jgi:hypothetical protein